MSSEDFFAPIICKLRTRAPLEDADAEAIARLRHTVRIYEAPGYIIREGMIAPRHCSFIHSGFSVRHKLTGDGHRQIVGMNLPGDFVDLQHLFLSHADHNVQVLTRVEAVDIDRDELQALALSRPLIARALWIDTLVEASIYREWILNIGRRDARQRIAHLLCEFAIRINLAGFDGEGYDLPMTQEQLGDAVGLTSVHVNRTLRALAADGIVQRDKRHVAFEDWERLRQIGDFSAHYLHLDQNMA